MMPASIDLRATVAARPWKTVAFAFGRAMSATVGGVIFSALRDTEARLIKIHAQPWLDKTSRPHARRDPNS